jgi:uncharacterized protein YbaR (Trm112 family)/SAM-dependent methyltransferase
MAKSLFDILACPRCRSALRRPKPETLVCEGCTRVYPVVRDVPILLPDPIAPQIREAAGLPVRTEYDPWIHRQVLQSLADDQIALDAGSGDIALDHPGIVRMDIRLGPHVDVVGDALALPFKSSSLDFVFSLALVEHLPRPFVAADELGRVLRPGGCVYAECNFIFAYHGHPRHYFNASLDGIREMFRSFREIRAGVAPYQTPGFALDNVVKTYLDLFRPANAAERRFARILGLVLGYPLRRYDGRLSREEIFKLAAGVYFFGLKPSDGGASIIPAPVLELYGLDPDLKRRFPDVYDLGLPDNIMTWAMGEGRKRPAIDAHFAALVPFSKNPGSERGEARARLRGLPPIVHPDRQGIDDPDFRALEKRAERMALDLFDPFPGRPGKLSLPRRLLWTFRLGRQIWRRLKIPRS